MQSTLSAFFSWPSGGVWSNLLASALTVVPGFIWHHRSIRKVHADALEEQTQVLKDHIDAKLGGPRA